MPDIQQYSELGAPIIMALLFLWYLYKKDKQSSEKDKQFSEIVANHINHSTKVQQQLIAKLDEEAETNRELLVYLRAKNGNK